MALGIDDPRSDSLRVPPHSVEAEESVLGAVLLDSDAANFALEKLGPEDFYRPAHQAIFDSVLDLFNRNEPVDAVTVAEGLRRSEMLERVGGLAYLTQLIDAVPATSNIEHYAAIVEEHALRRRLLRVGGDIGKLATEVDQPIAEVVDRAEQSVYAVSEKRVGEGLAPIDPLLGPAIERAEELHRHGHEVTGAATGLRDLDRKLAGLHPGNFIVIAGRPGMGKSTLAINIAQHIAVSGEPVAIFTLEMTREEIVSRMLCSQGRIDSQRLRTGRLTESDFTKLSNAANVLYKKPIFVDDSPGLTVTEIRAKCRRLKRRQGLGLVVVDYLQLMHGTGGENRQQEISIISRSLKDLARELEVPVIGASQLNRALEQREDKRPRLGDLRECLTAETTIRRADTGAAVTIKELADSGENDIPVWSIDDDFRLVPSLMSEAWSTGTKPVFRVTTTSGRSIRASGNHPLRTYQGWARIDELAEGDRIAVPRRLGTPLMNAPMDEDELILLAHLIGDGSYVARQPLRYTSMDSENHRVVQEAALRRFGVTARKADLPDRSWQSLLPAPYKLSRGRRNPICEWLDELGVFDQRSKQKRIPDRVFSIPDEQVRLFLRHLWATDGSVTIRDNGKRVGVYYATSSPGLAADVAALLLRLGFVARTKTVAQGKHDPAYHVWVSGAAQQRRFLEEVGVHGERSLIAREALEVLRGVSSNTNVDTVPLEVWDGVRAKMAASGVSQRALARGLEMSYCGTALFKSAMSRDRLQRVATVLEDRQLSDLADSDVLWDEIKSIEPDGVEEVFDARVPGTHNFVANEMVVHNSGAIEQDADIVLFIYRHEYYHPEAVETKGIAEVAIAKHRQGSVGRVDLTFLPEFTLFSDMGRDTPII
ncbi:MAG: replicative DNA helicase [Acidimicrobiia bacterium]|nr:replicative DNA helicase [Acidimicrobiia bacterium]